MSAEEPRKSATFIVTPQILPGLLKLVAAKNNNPHRVRWLICENYPCDRSRHPFTVLDDPEGYCPACGSSCASMDDQEEIKARPEQIIGRVEAHLAWDPIKKLYRNQASLQLADYHPDLHGTYIRYMPRISAVPEKKLIELLSSVNYRRTCDPNLSITPIGPVEHIIDLNDSIEDLQVSLADLEAAWEVNPLCPK